MMSAVKLGSGAGLGSGAELGLSSAIVIGMSAGGMPGPAWLGMAQERVCRSSVSVVGGPRSASCATPRSFCMTWPMTWPMTWQMWSKAQPVLVSARTPLAGRRRAACGPGALLVLQL